MTLQKELLAAMRRGRTRVSDLARALGVPYTTAREWVLYGRVPRDAEDIQAVARDLWRK